MPELPEVETIRRGLQDLIVGYQIVGMQTDSPKQVVPSLGLVAAAIQGGTLLRVDRRAKILQLFLDKQSFSANEKLKINDGKNLELRFCDARKFGWIKLLSNLSDLGDFGPEPFEKEFTVNYLKQIFFKTTKPVKVILMDQAKISGIGQYLCQRGAVFSRNQSAQIGKITKKRRNRETEKLDRNGFKTRS